MKKPAFFCENCGKEVAGGMDKCPSCGRTFSSVRCPKCGFSGNSDSFRNGCQSCGYAGLADSFVEIKYSQRKHFSTWIYIILIVGLSLTLLGFVRVCFLL